MAEPRNAHVDQPRDVQQDLAADDHAEGDSEPPSPPNGAFQAAERGDDAAASRMRVRNANDSDGVESERESAVDKPLLASEALMEDLAPVEPARKAARLWCVAVGVGFFAFGLLPLVGTLPGGVAASLPSFVLGGIALIAAAIRVPYRHRALAMVVLGSLCVLAGLRGTGPAAGIAVGGVVWATFRALAAMVLPAALLFRSRYRAYSGARWVLGAAFALALPYAGYAVYLLLGGEFGLPQAGALLAVVALAASLTGFMGAETTGAGSITSFAVVVALAGELAAGAAHAVTFLAPTPEGLEPPALLEALERGALPLLLPLATAPLAFAASCGLAALGLFQALSWRFAADARRIDLHRVPLSEIPSPNPSSPDWSSRA